MQTLNEALYAMTVDELKQLSPFVPDEEGGNRKADLVQRVSDGLLGEQGKKLKAQYEQLDKWQKLAVAEALNDPQQCYYADEFRAKYQHLPEMDVQPEKALPFGYFHLPSRLRLFIFNYHVPDDLVPLLKEFVPAPPAVRLPSISQLPEPVGDEEKLQLRLCEQEVLTDLPLIMNLLQQGKLKASAKTNRASAATVKLLAQSLNGGDFYDPEFPKRHNWSQEVGGIKAFAWPLLLQSAKLAQIKGSKLELSKAGVRQLSKPTVDTLRLLWQKWQKTTLLDEFRRVEAIKGQNAKGRVMTPLAARRESINTALRRCPPGEWIGVDSFFNYIQASRLHFDVTHDLWRLYLCDREYGSLGYAGHGNWEIVQGRYVLCLLFEYAATLGMVDVAYVHPEDARDDFRENWGADDYDFLSRYDGLRYFRLTALGTYCLGLSDEYEVPVSMSDCRFSVLPNLYINLVAGTPSAEDQLLLETWASRVTADSWKLDKVKAIQAIERGHDIDMLEAFLQGKDEQLLPEAVEGFIVTSRKQGKAIKQVAVSLLLECSSEDIAETLAAHKETCKLCQRVGKKQLVIKQSQEEKFRQAARIVGFGMVL